MWGHLVWWCDINFIEINMMEEMVAGIRKKKRREKYESGDSNGVHLETWMKYLND